MTEHPVQSVTRAELKAYADDEVRRKAAQLEIHDDFDPRHYTPPGPVAQRFINAPEQTAVIMGPLGGGKTTASIFRRLLMATVAPIAWHPEDNKPTRMCRWIVLRDTYRSAEKTVLESWKQWFPKTYPGSSFTGGNDRPFTHTLRFIGGDGIRIEAVTEFAGLNDMDIGTLMKGREYSGGWLNELDTHAEGALDDLEQRVGRYPKADVILSQDELAELSRALGRRIVSDQARHATVIGDMNAPTIDNWTYKALVTERAPDRGFYKQPSGRSAEAENRFNLEPNYYERIVRNQEEHFVRRMVDNEFGYSRAGKAVHPTFRHERHVARDPIPYRAGQDLLIGIDASTNALTPAAVLGQIQPSGRLAVIDELAFDHGYGPARFAEALLRRVQERYAGAKLRAWADPAAQWGGDKEAGQLAAMEIIGVVLGIAIELPFGGSNEIALRLDAVNVELRGYTDADTSLLISPTCTQTIMALAGRYRFKKRSETASTEYEDHPEKTHPWSDIMDALQYLVGGIRGRTATIRALTGGLPKARTTNDGEGRGWGSQRASRGGFDPHRF